MIAILAKAEAAAPHFFRDGGAYPQWKIMIVLGLLACAVALTWLFERLQHRRAIGEQPRPLSLFRSVMHRAGLPLGDRWRLWRLARAVNLEHPVVLLISPLLFDRAVEQYTGETGGGSAAFAPIRRRLFG